MKTLMYFLAVFLLVGATAANAQQNPLYFTGKVGVMDADISGFDNAMNIGVTVGYDLYTDPMGGIVSAEGELTTTISDGDVTGGGDWDADTLAVFGTYRSAGDLYFKGKLGYLDQDIKQAGSTAAIPNADGSGFAYGLGGGWRMDRASSLELEYTVASDELTFISVGYKRHF